MRENREPRRPVTLPGFALLEDGTTVTVAIVDLSYDGCKVEIPVALLPEAKVRLSVSRLGALDATVRWSKDGHAGLRFRHDDIPARSQSPRKEIRLELSADISLRRTGRQHYQARVFDLSRTGCKLEFVEQPKVGETLWVKFDGLESVEAEVRWVEGFRGGVEFKQAIYPAVFELLLARLRG